MDKKPHIAKNLPGGSVAGACERSITTSRNRVAPPLKAMMARPTLAHWFGSDFPCSRHRKSGQDVRDMIAGFDAFGDWMRAHAGPSNTAKTAKLFPRLAARLNARAREAGAGPK